MLGAEHFLVNLKSFLEQRFGFGELAHSSIEFRQIVEGDRRIGMLRAEHFLANLQSFFERIRLTNHTADRGSDLPRLISAGGPRSGRELGDSRHWHISQSR